MIEDKIAKDYFEEGNKNLDIGDYEKAIENYDKAIKLNPKYKEAYFNRGVVYYDLGKDEEVIKDYDKVIKLDSEYKEAYYGRGIAYYDLWKDEEAIKDYDKVIKLDSEYKEAYYGRGIAYYHLGKYEEAIKDCEDVIKIDSEYKEAYYLRGLARINLRKYEEAIKDYEDVIKRDSEDKEAYHNRGLAYYKLGEYEKAIKDYEEGIKIDSGYKEAYYGRGLAYSKLGEYKEALKDFSKCIDIKNGKKEKTASNNWLILDKPVNNIKFADNLYYFIYEILFNGTYENNLNKDEKLALIELIFKCDDLMRLFTVKENEKGKFVHYTKAKNLKFLLKKEKDLKKDEEGNLIFPKMRLNNAVYMNDPEEGKIFNNLSINGNIKNIINSHNENYTYLTCFCPEEEKDKLPMWVHYADGGSGIGIVFNEKFFKNTNLYRVQYLDAKNFKVAKISNSDTENKKNVKNYLKELIDILSKDIFRNNKNPIFLELTNIILNYISYLFKDEAYSYEQEVRIIKLRNYDDTKINEDFDVPRLYIDFENDISVDMVDEIIVGPKGNYEEIYAYAKYLGIKKVRKSDIKYR